MGKIEFAKIDVGSATFNVAQSALEKAYGAAVTPSEKVTNPSLNTVGNADVLKADDAFMMHDGVIKFDDRDKFTMIASPYGAMHESVADKIIGKPNNNEVNSEPVTKMQPIIQPATNNSLDIDRRMAMLSGMSGNTNNNNLNSNDIAKAIQQAITAGLSNVSWVVNLDPMAVDKAIKFNSGKLNS